MEKQSEVQDRFLYREEGYALIGAAMEVHRTLGVGFLEAVYQEALEIELNARGIPFRSQANLPIAYKGQTLGKHYVADLLIFDRIIVELKAVEKLLAVHNAQLINYLKATGYKVGYLVNFGTSSLEWKRLIYSPTKYPTHLRESAEIREICG